jgi:hypothetical protein
MALDYNSFGLRRVDIDVNIWPEFDRFLPGQLSKLLGVLNDDDAFTAVELEPESGLRLEGEQWVYDLSLSSVELRSKGFSDPQSASPRIRSLLETTRTFFAGVGRPSHQVAFFTDEIRVLGSVPDDRKRNVGDVVLRKLLHGLKQEDRDILPGLTGAGLRLIGDAEEGYHWHASIEPPHGRYESLGLWAQLMFLPPESPPRPGSDINTVIEQVAMGYNLVSDSLKTFASKRFT